MPTALVSAADLDIVDSIDSVERDADTDTAWATFDGKRDDVTLAVVAVVSAVEDRAPTDLEPLQSVVDTDALRGLMRASGRPPQSPTSTSFRYEGYEVTVSSEEIVEVTPVADA